MKLSLILNPKVVLGGIEWGTLYLVAFYHQLVYTVLGEMSTLNHLLFLKSQHQNVRNAVLGANSVLAEMREINSL